MKGKKSLRIAIRIILCAAMIAVLYWFMLPPLNFRSSESWFFVGLCIVLCTVICALSALKEFLRQRGGVHIIQDKNGKIKKTDSSFKPALSLKITFYTIAGMFALGLIASLIGAQIFNAARYRTLLTYETGDFAEDVAEISMNSIPVVDRDSATRLGLRKLGEMSDLVSQFEVDESYYTQINYNGTPVRVTPLIYGDAIKWLYNQKEGIPAYITVDMVTQETALVRLEEGMKYSESEYFLRNIYRHLRFQYPTKIFDEVSFEIDDSGTPYWVAPTVQYRIGLWSGRDIGGAVLVNAITGESAYYDIAEVPTWVDQVFVAELAIEQLNLNGKFVLGYWNSFFGQRSVLQTTAGYNYIAMNDDVYLYTGMTSVSADESNVGFVLVNLRTKETRYYAVPGAEEYSAMSSAEGQVQHLSYNATFPLLLNIYDRPTYFISLKDGAGLVKMYAFVDVQKYQVVGTGNTVNEAKENYISKLGAESDISIVPEKPKDEFDASGTVAEIESAVLNGNTCYYIQLSGNDAVYIANISVNSRLPFLKVGTEVSLTANAESLVSQISW